MSILDVIGGVIGSAGTAFNLGKDIVGLDYSRQLGNQSRLMDLQYQHNMELMQQQLEYQRLLARESQGYTQQNMTYQHELNLKNLAQQFGYNNYLTSVGRDIMGKRNSGINPSAGAGSSVGASVGLPQAGISPSAVPVAPSGSVSPGSISPSHFNYPDPVQASAVSQQNKESASRTELNRITALTQLKEQQARILKLMSESDLNKVLKDLNISENQLKSILLGNYDDILQLQKRLTSAQAVSYEADPQYKSDLGSAALTSAAAASTQANVSAYLATFESNRLAIQRMMAEAQKSQAQSYGKYVEVQQFLSKSQDRLNNALAEMNDELSNNYKKQGQLLDKDIDAYQSRLEKQLAIMDAQAHEAEERANLTAKEAENYEVKMYWSLVNQSLNTISNFLPTGQVGKVVGGAVKALRSSGTKSQDSVADQLQNYSPASTLSQRQKFWDNHPELRTGDRPTE